MDAATSAAWEAAKSAVREAADIVEIIGEQVALKRAGANFTRRLTRDSLRDGAAGGHPARPRRHRVHVARALSHRQRRHLHPQQPDLKWA